MVFYQTINPLLGNSGKSNLVFSVMRAECSFSKPFFCHFHYLAAGGSNFIFYIFAKFYFILFSILIHFSFHYNLIFCLLFYSTDKATGFSISSRAEAEIAA